MAGEYFFERSSSKLWPGGAKVCLFFDFDGTLVPIRKDPAACVLSREVRERLARLTASRECIVAVLSGRPLPDIRQRVGLDDVYYGGHHGLVISGPGMDFAHPCTAASQDLVGEVRRVVEKEVRAMRGGAWVEDKGFSFALHYRGTEKGVSVRVNEVFHDVFSRTQGKEHLTILKGKKVIEVMPNAAWDKGRASLLILDFLAGGCVPLYVGDDVTDESAFTALAEKGATVRVGMSKRTAARYYLKGQWEIVRFLREIETSLQA